MVVAASSPAGYNSAMRQIIRTLSAEHRQFTIGFLDTRQEHSGAYNQGMLPPGGGAAIATQVVRQQRQGGQDIFTALTDFVRDVQREAAGSAPASPTGSGAASSSSAGGVLLIVLGIIVVLAVLGVFLIARPRRKRRQQELREAKSAAQVT